MCIRDRPCADCSWHYEGETGRTVEERRKEHLRAITDLDVQRSEVARHAIEDGHTIKIDNMKIVEKELRSRIGKEE